MEKPKMTPNTSKLKEVTDWIKEDTTAIVKSWKDKEYFAPFYKEDCKIIAKRLRQQGYAKAIDDVRKAVGNKIILLNATEDSLIKSSENYPDLSGLLAERIKELDDMLKEIAKLESK